MTDSLITPNECYEMLVQTFLSKPNVTQEGKGFGSSALKINGKIFAMLTRGKLVVKLPRHRVEALVAAGIGERFDPRNDGRLMKEWLVVAATSMESWLPLATEAMGFVTS